MINNIWYWVLGVLESLDGIYISYIGCSLLEAFLGMTLFCVSMSLLLPWFYFEEDQDL